MVHFSTDLVYSGGAPPCSERSVPVPSNLYGWTKLLGDISVLRRNPKAVVLRTSVLIGGAPSGRPTFSDDLLAGRVERVWVDSFRHHTSIRWLARTAADITGSGFTGLVHAAGLHDQSRAAFAEALFRVTGCGNGIPHQAYSPRGMPRNLSLDMTLACAVLPVEPLDLESSIREEYQEG
jgi:dTDP-4-dehydrorhamnose reductase